ncbi:MAG: hypothetical protein ACPKPY_10765 [Nitrososphaeraceae archaeon]
MKIFAKNVVITLIIIIIIGFIALPYGDPRLISISITLEIIFIAMLIAILLKSYKKTLYFCIAVAIIVIIGNTLAPPHIHLMTTFERPFNAILLIIGGYILQASLIFNSIIALKKQE